MNLNSQVICKDPFKLKILDCAENASSVNKDVKTDEPDNDNDVIDLVPPSDDPVEANVRRQQRKGGLNSG